ncbi:hypothetical protein CA54_06780 [Symmachiella macrocystis]|uniref:Uncharacterized protein n=1 Tax=Symmachiella macrocystis TaxID=2527985 RepID=A0A5C6BKK4_9PLAN|nr:hypothetical protein CA54_06780 [Symmachiella macrocystis]
MQSMPESENDRGRGVFRTLGMIGRTVVFVKSAAGRYRWRIFCKLIGRRELAFDRCSYYRVHWMDTFLRRAFAQVVDSAVMYH